MLKDQDYDLVRTIATKSKGLAQYDTYIKDAQDCPECRNLWQQLKEQDERQVTMLANELKRHAREERL